jgi:hypothetical protein
MMYVYASGRRNDLVQKYRISETPEEHFIAPNFKAMVEGLPRPRAKCRSFLVNTDVLLISVNYKTFDAATRKVPPCQRHMPSDAH